MQERMHALEARLAAPTEVPPLESAVSQVAVAAIQQGAKNMEATATFMATISDLAAGRAAKLMGARRAKKADRSPNGRFTPNRRPACRLCDNEWIRDPQPAEITAHATHGTVGVQHAPQGVIAHVPEGLIELFPDGKQGLECENCGEPYKGPKPPGNGHVH